MNRIGINDLEENYHKTSQSNNFFIFLLPKEANYQDDYTIENCYDAKKYEAAYNQAVEEKKGHFDGLSIDKIAEDIKNKSKTILADNCKGFSGSDFDGFKPIFDIIQEIDKL